MKPDYGLDAPGVMRNLALGGLAAAVAAVFAQVLPFAVLPLTQADRTIMSGSFSVTAFVLLLESAWMLYSSKVGKLHLRERVFDSLALRGNERVLDVGSGRGLLLVAAAKRLPQGEAVGIDLWSARDLSGNRPKAALENARLEGIGNRITVVTGDMTSMPFADAIFDAVVASLSVHNVHGRERRIAAIWEIARVLKPGGRLAIVDIARTGEYMNALRQLGWTDVRRTRYWLRMFPPLRMVIAIKPGGLAHEHPSQRRQEPTSPSYLQDRSSALCADWSDTAFSSPKVVTVQLDLDEPKTGWSIRSA
jgi:arsenite methyltransferase